MKHVEIENNKLKDTQRKLRSELVSCEREGHVEFECPYPRIERDDTEKEKSNE